MCGAAGTLWSSVNKNVNHFASTVVEVGPSMIPTSLQGLGASIGITGVPGFSAGYGNLSQDTLRLLRRSELLAKVASTADPLVDAEQKIMIIFSDLSLSLARMSISEGEGSPSISPVPAQYYFSTISVLSQYYLSTISGLTQY